MGAELAPDVNSKVIFALGRNSNSSVVKEVALNFQFL